MTGLSSTFTGLMEALAGARLVPVTVVERPAAAVALGRALAAGGLSCVEITLRTAAGIPAIRALTDETDLLVGAGTVLTRQQVDDAVAAGARFVVSPGFSASVVRHCRELGVPVLPGVATATEVMAALDEECSVVKFFPAESSGGVATLRALRGPFTTVQFVPTGGITAALLPAYLAEPSVLAVGGSWMVASALIEAEDWTTITTLTADAVALARGANHGA